MTTIDVRSATGETTGTLELPAEIFDVQTNIPLIHQVVVAQLAAARQGTHKVKIDTRGFRYELTPPEPEWRETSRVDEPTAPENDTRTDSPQADLAAAASAEEKS